MLPYVCCWSEADLQTPNHPTWSLLKNNDDKIQNYLQKISVLQGLTNSTYIDLAL